MSHGDRQLRGVHFPGLEPDGLDIAERKARLDATADAAGCDRVAWHGETGDTCPRCHVEVPAGYLLALPASDITGCLRCLELQAHLFYTGLPDIPADLAGTGGQHEALRTIAQEFRQHIKAAARGREPLSRRRSAQRWAAQAGFDDGWDFEPADDVYPDDDAVDGWGRRASERWPKRTFARARPRGPEREPRPLKQARTREAPPAPGPAAVLGLVGTPPRSEIIAAFRRAALVCHPDYGGSAEAFRELVAARNALLGES